MADLTRLFVVGCSRSGTTIFQRELASFLGYYTLPETGFFLSELHSPKARFGALCRLRRSLEPETHSLNPSLTSYAKDLSFWVRSKGLWNTARSLIQAGATTQRFLDSVEQEALRARANGWIEKTPLHFLVLPFIREAVTGARFVFVFRDGRDVVASIVDRTRRFPRTFAGEDLPYAVELWNRAVAAGSVEAGSPDLCMISHETFSAYPRAVLNEVSSFFGLRPAPQARSEDGPPRVMQDEEEWKAASQWGVRPQTSKWEAVLTPDERSWALAHLDLDGRKQLESAPNYLDPPRPEA